MFKYLYGRMMVENVANNHMKDHVIAITRRCESYQHAEMQKDVGMTAFNGGFCSSALRVNRFFPADFTGESISCGVSTDNYMQEEIDDELKEFDIYVAEFTYDVHRKYKVALFMSEGSYPTDYVNEGSQSSGWEQKTPEEFCAIFREVFDDPYYY